jgi:probable H4MPT-linked C1 transfer pathway protein
VTATRRVGWDVGGAHLKAALAEDERVVRVVQVACPLWRGLDWLQEALLEALTRLGQADQHAATMTGELADIFPDRPTGVARITAMLAGAVAPARLLIYTPSGFIASSEATARAGEVASANWHATAALLARSVPDALLVDMGSTTTDLVPVAAGRPQPSGLTDAARLACGELVYTGLVRTPLMALADRAPFLGAWTTLAREHFATTSDAYRLLGRLPPDADLLPAADGREKSVAASRARIARMVGRDAAEADETAWLALAVWFAECQQRQLTDAALQVLSRGVIPPDAPLVTAGAGRQVAARLAGRLDRREVDFATLPTLAGVQLAAECAPAVAMALLPIG